MLTFILKIAIPSIKADLKYMIENMLEFGIKGIPNDLEYMCDNLKTEYAWYRETEV